MAKKLKDNLTSAYLGAAGMLSPKKHRRRIIAFVESYDDIAFWRSILADFENDEHYFQIMLPSSNSLTKGKKQVLMNLLNTKGLGRNMIACVDSDYDYLFQQSNKQSRQVNNNPFILQTYGYSIENFQCYAESLHEVCVQSTLNDRSIIDFPAFMRNYSQIVFPLFLWHLWFQKTGNAEIFPIHELSACTSLEIIDLQQPERMLQDIERRTNNKLTKLKKRYARYLQQIEKLSKDIEELGVTSDNTYLYMQGHHIFEHVVLRLLSPVCAALRREREREIRQYAIHGQQYQNELSCYENSQIGVRLMLKKNDNFEDLFLYERIRKDIADMLKKSI